MEQVAKWLATPAWSGQVEQVAKSFATRAWADQVEQVAKSVATPARASQMEQFAKASAMFTWADVAEDVEIELQDLVDVWTTVENGGEGDGLQSPDDVFGPTSVLTDAEMAFVGWYAALLCSSIAIYFYLVYPGIIEAVRDAFWTIAVGLSAGRVVRRRLGRQGPGKVVFQQVRSSSTGRAALRA